MPGVYFVCIMLLLCVAYIPGHRHRTMAAVPQRQSHPSRGRHRNLPAEFWFRKRTIIAYAARDTDFRFAGASTAAAAIHRRAITPPGRVTRDRSSASALLHAGKRKRVSIARAVAGQGYAWAQGVVEVRCSSSPFGIIAQKRRPMHARRNKGGRGSRGGKG